MASRIDFEAMKQVVVAQLPRDRSVQAHDRAVRFATQGVIVSQRFGDLPFDDGRFWLDHSQRTRSRFVHGFLFLTDWHGTVLEAPTTRVRFGALALGLVRRWDALFGQPGSITPASHHDETTAQRLIHLTALLPVIAETQSEDDFRWLLSHAVSTADLLASDEFHSAGNNHGMFQDLALLYFGALGTWLPYEDRSRYFDLSVARLHTYFSNCFTTDGVHKENTPTYHLMAAKHVHALQRILDSISHPHAHYYAKLLQGAAQYATHALMPNSVYPPISDTTQQDEGAASRRNIFSSAEFAYAASHGKLGTKPSERTLVLPDSGYAIYRSAWGDPNATFVLFSAAYNADYHKHSDDLSLFLRSRGVDLLSEAGAYGYDYKDPLTKYAYSSYAHNCLVVDGVSLPRTDDKGHLTTLHAHEVRPDGFTVTGRTARLNDTVHGRTVDISESDGTPAVNVHDVITSGSEHSFELLWNLGTEVEAVLHGQGFELFHGGKKVMDLFFEADVPTKITLHTGQTRPKYMGWRFPKFGVAVPAPVVRVAFEGSAASIRTRIRLADFTYVDRNINAQGSGWKRSNSGLNFLVLEPAAPTPPRKLVVAFTAIHQPGDFTYNYKKTLERAGFHSLFILDDFGDQGSYYFTDHGDRHIFDSVQDLLAAELDRLNLKPEGLVMVGSSKGGSAAMLHGVAARAGRILVGAPQTRVGTFLHRPHPNILQFMTGSASEESASELDRQMFEHIAGISAETKLSILVGEADHHLRGHVLPLDEHLRQAGIDIDVTVLPGHKHSEIGPIYSRYLEANLEQLSSGTTEVALPHTWASADLEEASAQFSVMKPVDEELAFRLFRDQELISSTPYGSSDSRVWANLAAGRYRVRAYSRSLKTGSIRAFTTKWIRIP